MKKSDFANVIRDVPRYAAKFRLIKLLPNGYLESRGVQVGDMYFYHSNGTMLSEKGNCSISPCSSKFEFVGYVRVRIGLEGVYEEIKT